MPRIFKGTFSSKLEKIRAQIRQGAFDKTKPYYRVMVVKGDEQSLI